MGADDRGWGPGWPNCQHDRMVSLTVAGVDFPQGVHEKAEPVLRWVAEQFHQRVEPLHDGWCWGFDCRPIGGSNTPSNHSWGLAIDVNAPDHPYGQSGTFTDAQVTEIRRICDEAGCRWGGDYDSTVDPMHVEFMGTQADADRIAARLGTEEDNDMIGLSKGDSGERVEGLQVLIIYAGVELPEYGVDGHYGSETAEGLRKVRESVGSRAKDGYGDSVSGYGYAQLMAAVARNQD